MADKSVLSCDGLVISTETCFDVASTGEHNLARLHTVSLSQLQI